MPRKKTPCKICGELTYHKIFDLTFSKCNECGEWRPEFLSLPLAIVMKNQGFDFHAFADAVDMTIEKVRKEKNETTDKERTTIHP